MASLRIAMALPHLGVYGGIRRFLELGNLWAERGHQVALLTPAAREGEGPWLPFSGRLATLDALSIEAWDVLLSPDPDLFASCRAPGALRVFYAVLERAPGESRAIRSADLVLANSRSMRRYLERKGVAAADGAGGVNLGFFHPPIDESRTRRANSGGPLRALVFGRLSRRRKGSWIAARAVERAARAAGVRVEIVLFDAPPPGAGPPALEGPLSVPHRWILNPTQRELVDLYGGSDIFVSAERRAGWCNTAAEAMACGTTLVCTRSGTEDFSQDGETAAVVRWPWTWLLARAIAPLLVDPARRAKLARRGLERIQEFSWEKTADRIERAITDKLGGTRDGLQARRAV